MLAPLRFCASPGCSERVRRGRCEKHQRERDTASREMKDPRYSTAAWQRARREVLDEKGPWCVYCLEESGKRTVATCVDHRVPSWASGVEFTDKANLFPSCSYHNAKKIKSDRQKYQRGASRITPPVIA